MASTLRGSDSFDTADVATQTELDAKSPQIATAWANIDGEAIGSATLREGFNFSATITHASDGLYGVSFSTPMDNTNYIVNISVGNNGTEAVALGGMLKNPATEKTVNGFKFVTFYTNGGAYRCGHITITVFGGKA